MNGRRPAVLLKIGTPLVLLVVVGFVVAYRFVDPAPPGAIVLATGPEGGAYAALGEAYRERLATFDVEVELRQTAGSAENLALLRDQAVDVAFVQGGVATDTDRQTIESIGSLFYEPLWVFLRSGVEAERLTDLTGRRVSVGPAGSGTSEVATRLLERNGRTGDLDDLAIEPSAEALLAGEVDAILLTAGAESPLVRRLLLSDSVPPFSFRSDFDLAQAIVEADRIEREVAEVEAPASYAQELYDLHLHLEFVQRQLAQRAAEVDAGWADAG